MKWLSLHENILSVLIEEFKIIDSRTTSNEVKIVDIEEMKVRIEE